MPSQATNYFYTLVAVGAVAMMLTTEATGATARVSMRLPQHIGDKRYWIRLRSDASGARVEGAFGDPWAGEPRFRVGLPWNVSASGTYKGGYGTLALNCTVQGSETVLTLGRWEVG